ncbi:hypothetical protein L2D14_18425 [Thalassospiraceae bacterium LMO-JJ14]|nr:hypothetical protein L2D14_18425 [Thalassospiraceae bacterium LMO-JJ14]
MRDMIDWERLRGVLKALRRRWKVFAGLLLVYMVLFTEVNLNPDVETYMTPVVTDEQAMAASGAGDWETVIRFTAQRAMKGEVEAQALLADFYDRGMPPLHVDHCRAFDWYEKAGQNGDLKSQKEVAEDLIYGFGGFRSVNAGYLWARHALEQGYAPAQSTIDIYFKGRLSESDMARLDAKYPDWTPADQEAGKYIEMPNIPFLTGIVNIFVPVRFCSDPTLFQHLVESFR